MKYLKLFVISILVLSAGSALSFAVSPELLSEPRMPYDLFPSWSIDRESRAVMPRVESTRPSSETVANRFRLATPRDELARSPKRLPTREELAKRKVR